MPVQHESNLVRLPQPKAITDGVTAGTVDRFAGGGSLVLRDGWRQAAQEKALQWMAGEDGCAGKVWPARAEEMLSARFPLFCPPDSERLSDPVHHHTWHLELCRCSLFPEHRDSRVSVKGFSILATFENTKILVPKWMIFVESPRTEPNSSNTVLFTYTAKCYKHLLKRSF